jgi:hypothetical protein
MRKTELTEKVLRAAVVEMEQGLIDADLGGGVVKKRVALPGRGKSGGARTLVATNKGTFQKVATDLLALSAKELDAHVESGAIQEISNDDQA